MVSCCQKHKGTSHFGCPYGRIVINLCHRLILSSTGDLHGKIDQLTERIRELEEALAALQVSCTFTPTPRLSY